MKKIASLLILTMICGYASAQVTCPNSIKTTGQSTPAEPIFTVPNGQNGCNAAWPSPITINGSLIYTFVGCSGGNLTYELNPANQTPPSTFEMTIDFGDGTVCSYDSNGDLTTLSLLDFKVSKVALTPNPTSGILNIIVRKSNSVLNTEVYSLIGKKVYESSKKTIDLTHLKSGVYLLKIQTNKGFSTHRIIRY